MANPQKAKGDKAELEAAALLTEALGLPVRRKLGLGACWVIKRLGPAL